MNSAPERWLPVAGWAGIYSVSDMGRVRSETRVILLHGATRVSRQTIRARFLKPAAAKGYPYVVLCRDGQPKNRYVHHLVLEAFVGPRPDGMECRHLDGNTQNAALLNLVWGTPVDNAADRERHGTQRRGEQCAHAKLTLEQAKRIAEDGRLQRVIAADFGITQTTVSRIKRGRAWAHI